MQVQAAPKVQSEIFSWKEFSKVVDLNHKSLDGFGDLLDWYEISKRIDLTYDNVVKYYDSLYLHTVFRRMGAEFEWSDYSRETILCMVALYEIGVSSKEWC